MRFGVAVGGLLGVAFLSAGAAFAAGDEHSAGAVSATAMAEPDAPGKDAFTLGDYVFDPVTLNADGKEVEGFTPVSALWSFPPFVSIGGGSISLLGTPAALAEQAFDIYSGGPNPRLVGLIDTNEDTGSFLNMFNTELTVSAVAPASGIEASALPAVGTVYDVFNMGLGFENVYKAGPGTDGGTVTDTLVTPLGKLDLTPLFSHFDATQPINPGDAFTGLTDTAAGSAAGIASVGDLFSL